MRYIDLEQEAYTIDFPSAKSIEINTVSPSAINLNKEKIMSFSLDGPLYLGSNNLQKQVDTNTENIASLQEDVSDINTDMGNLSNLATSDKSSLVNAINETLSVLDPTQTADYIKNSKGLESGEVSSNSAIYPWVEELSHSTFDRSKFTVVGSPNITADGIASGFSSSNYLHTIIIDYSKPWEIKFRAKFNSNYSNAGNAVLNFFGHNDYPNSLNIERINSLIPVIDVGFTITEGASSRDFNLRSVGIEYDTYYDVVVGWTGAEYYLKHKLVSDNIYTEATPYVSSSHIIGSTLISSNPSLRTLDIGMTDYNHYFNGSIDLKQFSITVDGVEVFSGNKTGIDTIKPDDYTVVNSPTISADGILDGSTTSTSSYLSFPYDITNAKSFRLELEATSQTSSGGSSRSGYLLGAGDTPFTIYVTNNGTSSAFDAGIKNSSSQTIEHLSYNFCPSGTSFKFVYELKDGNWTISVDTNAGYSDSVSIAATSVTSINSSGTLKINSANSYWDVNLNALKLYINGSLVYQPCLKIPFTLSKTGSKIVSSIYRDRVEDMYQQYGYAPYYTLDTENENYTIPKGELYGLVNKAIPMAIAPDYSKPVSLTFSNNMVVDSDGWLEVQIQSSEASANPFVSLNGSIICRTAVNSTGDLNRDTSMVMVRTGDVITAGGYSADTAVVLTKYPFRV